MKTQMQIRAETENIGRPIARNELAKLLRRYENWAGRDPQTRVIQIGFLRHFASPITRVA